MTYMNGVSAERARARISKLHYCLPRAEGRLNLINLENATCAFLVKWVLKVLEPGQSNLQRLLRFRLESYQPYLGGSWPQSPYYFSLFKHQSPKGSASLNRVIMA